MAKTAAPRGAALLASVITAIEAEGELPSNRMLDAKKAKAPKPLPASKIAALTLANGRPLPPSLAAWFAYDSAWQPFRIDDKTNRLVPSRFSDLLAALLPELAEPYAFLGEQIFPGDCYPVLVPSLCDEQTILFLYEPATGADGEPPVAGFSFTDDGIVALFAAGFDVYMARVMDVCERLPYAFGIGPENYADAQRAALDRWVAAMPKPTQKKIYRDDAGVISVGALVEY